MNAFGKNFGGPAKQRPGWLIPLAVFFVTACLSALVLAYYFAPAPPGLTQELPAPTDATNSVALSVGAEHFHVPANFILLASARKGGTLSQLAMAARLPDFDGYTLGAAQDFTANAPDSRAIDLALRDSPMPLPEAARLDRIYRPQAVNRDGEAGPYGLTHFVFRAESGYHDQDLFAAPAEGAEAAVLLLCSKPGPDTPSPNCMRDTALGEGLALSYRFKRTQLAQWRQIDSGVRALIVKFRDKD